MNSSHKVLATKVSLQLAWYFTGMKLQSKLSISFLQVVVTGCSLHSKHFIVAPNLGGHPSAATFLFLSFFYGTTLGEAVNHSMCVTKCYFTSLWNRLACFYSPVEETILVARTREATPAAYVRFTANNYVFLYREIGTALCFHSMVKASWLLWKIETPSM